MDMKSRVMCLSTVVLLVATCSVFGAVKQMFFNQTGINTVYIRGVDDASTSSFSAISNINVTGEAEGDSKVFFGNFIPSIGGEQMLFIDYPSDNWIRFRVLACTSCQNGDGQFQTVFNVIGDPPELAHMSVAVGHFDPCTPGDQILFFNSPNDSVMRLRKVNSTLSGLDTVANFWGLEGLYGCKAIAGKFTANATRTQILFYDVPGGDNYLRFWEFGGATGGVGNGGYFNTIMNVMDSGLAHAYIAAGNVDPGTSQDELVFTKMGDSVVRIKRVAANLSGFDTVVNVFGEDATAYSKVTIGNLTDTLAGDEMLFYGYSGDNYVRVRSIGCTTCGIGGGGWFNTIANVNDASLNNSSISIGQLLSTSTNQCGSWGYYQGDLNLDCKVDFKDFATFVRYWMACTDPTIVGCDKLK